VRPCGLDRHSRVTALPSSTRTQIALTTPAQHRTARPKTPQVPEHVRKTLIDHINFLARGHLFGWAAGPFG